LRLIFNEKADPVPTCSSVNHSDGFIFGIPGK
jgi:hypothetical protein